MFDATNEGKLEKLTHGDEIQHCKSLIKGNALSDLNAAIEEAMHIPTNTHVLEWDLHATCLNFLNLMKQLFLKLAQMDVYRREYGELVAKGYFSGPGTIARQLKTLAARIGSRAPQHLQIENTQALNGFSHGTSGGFVDGHTQRSCVSGAID